MDQSYKVNNNRPKGAIKDSMVHNHLHCPEKILCISKALTNRPGILIKTLTCFFNPVVRIPRIFSLPDGLLLLFPIVVRVVDRERDAELFNFWSSVSYYWCM
eukprot:sb/3478320/